MMSFFRPLLRGRLHENAGVRRDGDVAAGPSGPQGPARADVETSSERYARRFDGPVGRWFLDVQRCFVLELLAVLTGDAAVLEVGAGHGQLVPALLAAGFLVTAFASDPSCAARLAPWLDGRRLRFDAGDLLALPYPDRSFDAALSVRLLGHLPEWPRLIDELCRVSRRLVVVDFASTRSWNAFASLLFACKTRIEGDTRPFLVLSPHAVAEAFARNGFRVTAAAPQYFWPMALHRALGSTGLARGFESPPRALGLTRAFGSPLLVRAERS